MVDGYVHMRQTMGMAANRQKVYHDEDTATCFFKPSDWVSFTWNKPKSLQTLSCGWTGPFVMVVKVSPMLIIQSNLLQMARKRLSNVMNCS